MDKRYTNAQIRSILDRASKKMQDLTKDVIITTGIVFTSDTEFYYIFNVFKDNKIADKVRANDVITFDRVFKELANKYEVNIIYDYGDLTYMQLKYLAEELGDIPNRVEQVELNSAYMDSMLTF